MVSIFMSDYCCSDKAERRWRLFRRILKGVGAFVILILFIVFLVWIILRPTKPRFTLQDANLYAFNLNLSSSSAEPSPPYPTPGTLTLAMQVTLSSHNPNDRIGVSYLGLEVYASYLDQQVSPPVLLPPTYQDHHDTTVWSPFLNGTSVLLPPYAVDSLLQEQNTGGVLVKVKVDGTVKWKVGSWMSGNYHIYVNCPAYLRFAGDRVNVVAAVGLAGMFQNARTCGVDV